MERELEVVNVVRRGVQDGAAPSVIRLLHLAAPWDSQLPKSLPPADHLVVTAKQLIEDDRNGDGYGETFEQVKNWIHDASASKKFKFITYVLGGEENDAMDSDFYGEVLKLSEHPDIHVLFNNATGQCAQIGGLKMAVVHKQLEDAHIKDPAILKKLESDAFTNLDVLITPGPGCPVIETHKARFDEIYNSASIVLHSAVLGASSLRSPNETRAESDYDDGASHGPNHIISIFSSPVLLEESRNFTLQMVDDKSGRFLDKDAQQQDDVILYAQRPDSKNQRWTLKLVEGHWLLMSLAHTGKSKEYPDEDPSRLFPIVARFVSDQVGFRLGLASTWNSKSDEPITEWQSKCKNDKIVHLKPARSRPAHFILEVDGQPFSVQNEGHWAPFFEVAKDGSAAPAVFKLVALPKEPEQLLHLRYVAPRWAE